MCIPILEYKNINSRAAFGLTRTLGIEEMVHGDQLLSKSVLNHSEIILVCFNTLSEDLSKLKHNTADVQQNRFVNNLIPKTLMTS